MNYPFKKLSEVADIIRGVSYNAESAFPEKRDGTIAILRAGNIQQELVLDKDLIFVDTSFVSSIQFIRKNDIAMCMSSGSANLVGKTAFSYNDAECSIGAFCSIIRPRQNILPKYLFYFLYSNLFTRWSHRAEGIGIKNIKLNELKEFLVKYPDENIQSHIIDVIDKIDKIISLRQQQLAKLDELVKSRFVEMFGDMRSNPMNWRQMTLRDISMEKLSYGYGASAKKYDGDVRYIRITDIDDSGELSDDFKSPDNFDKKYLLNNGDILFARSGATVGKTFQFKEKYGKCIYAGYLIRLIPNTDIVLPEYVFQFTKTCYYYSFIESTKKAVAQPNINAQEYGDLIINIPPLAKQRVFVIFIQYIEKTKSVIKQSLNQLETLKKAKMQEFFG